MPPRVLLAVAVALGGCTLLNDVDVCTREPTAERELNRITDGNQATRSVRGIAPVPGDLALVTFVSAVGDDRQEVRGALVDSAGARVDTCNQETEVAYSVFRETGPVDEASTFPAYVAPEEANGDGLLLFLTVLGDLEGPRGGLEIALEGRFVQPDGCVSFPREQPTPTLLDRVDGGALIGAPAVLRVADELFVAVWAIAGAEPTDGGLFAQVIRPGAFRDLEFQPVFDALRGGEVDGTAPVALRRDSTSGVDAVAIGDGHFATLSMSLRIPLTAVSFSVYDDRLRPVVPFREIDLFDGVASSLAPSLAFDGERYLLVWTRTDPSADSRERAVAMVLDADGDPVPTRHSPSGEPFFLVEDPTRSQTDPTVVVLPEGEGFLVVFADSAGNDGDAIRAVVLDADGDVAFVNAPCDRTDFRVHGDLQGPQADPTAAVLDDGSILIGWTDRGQNGPDASGSSVRVQRTDLRSLLPLP